MDIYHRGHSHCYHLNRILLDGVRLPRRGHFPNRRWSPTGPSSVEGRSTVLGRARGVSHDLPMGVSQRLEDLVGSRCLHGSGWATLRVLTVLAIDHRCSEFQRQSIHRSVHWHILSSATSRPQHSFFPFHPMQPLQFSPSRSVSLPTKRANVAFAT